MQKIAVASFSSKNKKTNFSPKIGSFLKKKKTFI